MTLNRYLDKINIKYLLECFNTSVTVFLTTFSLFSFWKIDLLKNQKSLMWGEKLHISDICIVPLILFLIIITFLYFLRIRYLNHRLTLIFYITCLFQIPFSFQSKNPTLTFEALGLHAIFLAMPFTVLFYNALKRNFLNSKFQNKNIKYYVFSTFTFIYSLFVLIRHYSFRSNGQDLGVYIQTIHELGRQAPIQLTNWYGLTHPFAIHFEPILYLFIPFEYLKILPPVLLVVQVLGVTLGIFGIYKISNHLKLPGVVPFLTSIIYAISPGIQHGLVFDFHTTMLMPSFIIFIFYFIIKRDTKATLILTLIFLLIKEDAAAYTLFFGIYSIWSTRNFRLGWSLIALGSIYGFLAVGKIIPTFGNDKITNFVFDRLGSSLSQTFKTLIFNPIHSISVMLSPFNEKLTILMSTILHGGILTILGYKELILLIPMFGMRFFTEFDRMWGFSMYYAAPSIAVITVATIKGYSLLSSKEGSHKYAPASLIYGTIFSVLLGTMPQIQGYYSKSIYRSLVQHNYVNSIFNKNSQSVRTAIKLISNNESICSSQAISPHLSMRDESTFLGSSVCDNSYENVLINIDLNNWPLSSKEVIDIMRNLHSSTEYKVMYSEEGTVLFSKRCCEDSKLSNYILERVY